jgi:hypothetical protein
VKCAHLWENLPKICFSLFKMLKWLTPWVPAALVMLVMVDVGRMSCSSLAAHSNDIHQSKDTFSQSWPLTDLFHPKYSSSNKHFPCQNFKTNYNVVPHGDCDTEGVKYHCINWGECSALITLLRCLAGWGVWRVIPLTAIIAHLNHCYL